jgi:hypothetical protein
LLVDGEAGLAIRAQLDGDGAGGGGGIEGDGVGGDAGGAKAFEGFLAEGIPAHPRDHAGLGAEGAGVIGEVGRGPAKLATRGKEVPEKFPDAGDAEGHEMGAVEPDRFQTRAA